MSGPAEQHEDSLAEMIEARDALAARRAEYLRLKAKLAELRADKNTRGDAP